MILHRTFLRLIAFSIVLVGSADLARAVMLSDLLTPGATIQVGDLLFDNFSYLQTGDMPAATGVNVTPFTALSGDNGLMIQGAFTDLPGNQGSDALITYRVTDITPGNSVVGSTLSGVPTVLGGAGTIGATQSFLPNNVTDTMSIFATSPGSSQLTTNLDFAGLASLNVQDSVLAFAIDGTPQLSFFTPTFHTTSVPIPEPASITLVGMAVATLAWSPEFAARSNQAVESFGSQPIGNKRARDADQDSKSPARYRGLDFFALIECFVQRACLFARGEKAWHFTSRDLRRHCPLPTALCPLIFR